MTLLTPAQLRMARSGLRMTVAAVAEAASVSPATVTSFENGGNCRPPTLKAIKTALAGRGVFFNADSGMAGVYLPVVGGDG
ncbi:helix-turn-helix domain-containing protein [Acetobacter sacchari]|uniref:Helix-turn-helix domain-containing protein n=1 Tax=Acetobacter sacchari TaxID=2661687 RepID=A0ABS3M194_9PROT|nr:helix-turn-helix domain-containing protein [Acetobacter sacchari]MBO1361902.1 helix-turn-helix domain-containing protein [Acetobacter sacchari]